ncbi:MAG: hypothetical protein ACOX4M_09150 [Acetivibrionales bacterium]|jgi:hypothetical protein
MLSELTECAVLMLKVIHEMYKKQRITYEEFVNFTELKIRFLASNIDCIPSEAIRRDANDIICKCNSLIEGNNRTLLM